MGIELDKYYTNNTVVKMCLDALDTFGLEFSEIVEPSAGGGAFINEVEDRYSCKKTYLDIKPEHHKVTQQDFLEYEKQYEKGVLVLGNPPFGSRNSLILKFFKKSIEFCDYIAFILPISQKNNSKQLYQFDLILSLDLGVQEYSGVMLHCCFNVYKRPDNGVLNKKPMSPSINGLEVIEYRRDKNDSYKKKIRSGHFHSICSWGNGSVGVQPTYIGQYSMELYFYSEDKILIDIIKNIRWKEEVDCISAKKIPKGLALEIISRKINDSSGG